MASMETVAAKFEEFWAKIGLEMLHTMYRPRQMPATLDELKDICLDAYRVGWMDGEIEEFERILAADLLELVEENAKEGSGT